MRIIAGKHRGLSLNSFDADNIRPTIDRVRENIFNKIQFGIKDSRVLDLFGGTGAVSLEFLSRGAAKVITCDNNKNSISLIKSNFDKAKEKLNLIENDFKFALEILSNERQIFDYIFLDPPFASSYGSEAIRLITKYNLLADDGMIIFEHSAGDRNLAFDGLELVDLKKYGTISVSFFKKSLESKTDA